MFAFQEGNDQRSLESLQLLTSHALKPADKMHAFVLYVLE